MALFEKLGDAVRGLSCQIAGGYSTLAKNLPSIADGPLGKDAVADAYKFQALYCNNPPPDVQYSPGKCPIRYVVKVPVQVAGSTTPSQNGTYNFEFFRWGSIGTATLVKDVDGSPNGISSYSIRLASHGDAFGTRTASIFTEAVASGFGVTEPAQPVILGTSSSKLNPGDSDTCTPEEAPDYDPDDFTFNITVNNTYNDGSTLNIPITAIVGQFFVDANLNINMPVKLTVNPSFKFSATVPVTFNANLNLNTGDVSYDITNNSNDTTIIRNPNYYTPPNTVTPDPNLPTRPPSVPDTAPDNDPTASERIIRAVVVTATTVADTVKAGILYQGENPDIRYPSLGVVSFQIALADGSTAWTSDLPVKNDRCFIPCDWELGAVGVKGTPIAGVTWVITPIYLEQKLEVAT